MKINVGVFFGGSSVEHEISVISALQAIHAMDAEKYNIVPIYLSKNANMYTGKELLDSDNFRDMTKLLSDCDKVTVSRSGDDILVQRMPPKRFGNNLLAKLDVAFPIVHGTNCEDGTMQGFFELLRLPYVGCDVLSSAIGMDKVVMKQVLIQNEIPVVKYTCFYAREWNRNSEAIIEKIENEIRYPVIVKPANLGSSVGIKKAANRDQLEEAVSLAQAFAPKILVEKAIVKLKEINCSVLGDYEKADASACEEPIGSDEILSYSDKYIGGGSSKGSSKGMQSTKRKLPAELKPEDEKRIKELAVDTFKAIGCNGVSRIDFLIDMETEEIFVNEINTIPGSLSFYLWEATGKSFKQMLDDLIGLALKREREKKQLMYTYDSNIFSMKGTKGSKGKS